MGQTGRRSIATHILAVKMALAAAHFHGFGVTRQGPWITSVNKGQEEGPRRYVPRPSQHCLSLEPADVLEPDRGTALALGAERIGGNSERYLGSRGTRARITREVERPTTAPVRSDQPGTT
jgi:hypothetical protein